MRARKTIPNGRHRAGALVALIAFAMPAVAFADDYQFAPAPQIDLNRIYRVDRNTGEVSACQYGVKEGTVGVTLCYPPGEGAGGQSAPGDYALIGSSHQHEGGIFRVNRRSGEVSVCYVLSDHVVCTPQAR